MQSMKTVANPRFPKQTVFIGKTPNLAFAPQSRTRLAERQARPIVTGQSMHVVLRSDLAKGRMSLRKHDVKIRSLIGKMGKNHGVHIYKLANAGNHIHVHLRVTRKLVWKGFISGLAGGIARAVGFSRAMTVGQTKDGKSAGKERSFWSARPFTRRVSWGHDFAQIRDYLDLNQLEADGVLPPRSQMKKPRNWRRIVKINRLE